MAILRHRAAAGGKDPARLLYSARTYEQIIYAQELEVLARKNGLAVSYTLTRTNPPGWKGYARRMNEAMLEEVRAPLGRNALAFIFGPTAPVRGAAEGLKP